MTRRLVSALRQHCHLQGPRVVYTPSGEELALRSLQECLEVVCKRANVRYRSPHCLHHTFCSHLAMRGAPARAIQELAGHADLQTTQHYMHLTPAALEGAISLLEQPTPIFSSPAITAVGDIVETENQP